MLKIYSIAYCRFVSLNEDNTKSTHHNITELYETTIIQFLSCFTKKLPPFENGLAYRSCSAQAHHYPVALSRNLMAFLYQVSVRQTSPLF